MKSKFYYEGHHMKVATEIREYLNSLDSLGMLDCGSP